MATRGAVKQFNAMAQLHARLLGAGVPGWGMRAAAWTRLGTFCGPDTAAQMPGAAVGDAPPQGATGQAGSRRLHGRHVERSDALPNTLWGAGKLRLDLTAEGACDWKVAPAAEARLHSPGAAGPQHACTAESAAPVVQPLLLACWHGAHSRHSIRSLLATLPSCRALISVGGRGAGPGDAPLGPVPGPLRCCPQQPQLLFSGRLEYTTAAQGRRTHGGGNGPSPSSSNSGGGSKGLVFRPLLRRRRESMLLQEEVGQQRRPVQQEEADEALRVTKSANNRIKACQTLSKLQQNLTAAAAVLDKVCVSTAWVRAAHLCTDEPPHADARAAAAPAPADNTRSAAAAKAAAEAEEEKAWWRKPQGERLEEGQAFGRDVLLGLTPTWLPKMGIREAANTLWAMGKLRLDLAAEGERGQKAAAAVEARMLELLAKPGLQDARDAEQLWLGLRLCTYGWSDRLLRALADATLAKVVEWSGNAKNLAQICQHMPLMLDGRRRINRQQRAALAEAIRRAVSSPHSNQQELLLGCVSLMFAGAELDLPLDASTAQRLHGLALDVPLTLMETVGLKIIASNLVNATRLGYQPTVAEAQAWQQRFQDLTGRSTDTWTAEEFGYVVSALESCRAFKPPPPEMLARLRQEVAALPPQEGKAQRGTLPWRLQLACKAWGVQRPLSWQLQATTAGTLNGADAQP